MIINQSTAKNYLDKPTRYSRLCTKLCSLEKYLTANSVSIIIDIMNSWKPEDIKKLRETLTLSQKAFGDLLGVTRNFIYYLERGERRASKTLLILLDYVKEKYSQKK